MERAPAAEASHGRSGELPARPVDGTECVLFRRRGAGGQQRVGTGDEARGAEPQELALRGQPARRKNRGDSGQPGLDLPPPPGGSAALLTQLLLNLPPLLRQLPHTKLREPHGPLDAWLPDQWKRAQAARSTALGIPAPPTMP